MRIVITLVAVTLSVLVAMPAAAGVKATPYGFVLLNASYNDFLAVDIPIVMSITDTSASYEMSNFLMTARQTRLGLKLESRGRLEPMGKIELDFYGLKTTSSSGPMQSTPRLRLAYFTISPCPSLKVLFGQNWSIFAPRNPKSLMHVSVPGFSGSGNLWNRFPQITLIWQPMMDDDRPLTLKLSGVRPIATNLPSRATQPDLIGAGEENGVPYFQGHLSYEFMEKCTAGISAHWGQGDYRNDPSFGVNPGADDTYDTWGIAADLGAEFGPATIEGEFFSGKNLPMFFSNGSITWNDAMTQEQEIMGGWGQLGFQPAEEWGIFAGAGAEEVEDVLTNFTAYGSIMYYLSEGITAALEYGYIQTGFEVGADDPIEAENNNLNLSFQWKF